MIGQLFRNNRRPSQAETHFQAIAGLALQPVFFANGGAPDTVEGRFDVLALHMALVLSRLKRSGDSHPLIEPLQREFFSSLDDAMRRLGVGDMAVARKVRRMAEAFYGRFLAYEKSLAAGDPKILEEAISRNLFGAQQAAEAGRFASYMIEANAVLSAADDSALLAALGEIHAVADRVFASNSTAP
jgi:cytochrome b pre-mRNA-processing protein 3